MVKPPQIHGILIGLEPLFSPSILGENPLFLETPILCMYDIVGSLRVYDAENSPEGVRSLGMKSSRHKRNRLSLTGFGQES